jgi:type IVB pilus formation R64 PilN family outer membrane protein
MRHLTLALFMVFGMTACSMARQLAEDHDDQSGVVDQYVKKTKTAIHEAFSVSEAAYLDVRPMTADDLNESWLNSHIDVMATENYPLADLTDEVQRQTGVIVKFNEMKPNSIVFNGTLKGFCDYLAGKTGLEWELDGKVIHFTSTKIKTFYIAELPGRNNNESALSSSTGTIDAGSSALNAGTSPGVKSEQSGSGGLRSRNIVDLDAWTEIKQSITSIAGSGAQVTVNPTLGSVTVFGSVAGVNRVEQWVAQLNQMQSVMVQIEMHVYSISLTREDNYGVTPNLIWSHFLHNAPLSLSGATGPQQLGSSGVTNLILGSDAQGKSSALVSALSDIGQVTTVFDKTDITKSGRPVLNQFGSSKNYVSSVSTVATANVGTSSSLNTSSINVGFNSYVLPRLVGHDIHLSIAINSSDLEKIDQFGANGVSVQEPLVNSTGIQNEVVIKPGQTVLLTSFSSNTGQLSGNGVGSPFNPLLGGGIDAANTKKIIAVTISANTLRSN